MKVWLTLVTAVLPLVPTAAFDQEVLYNNGPVRDTIYGSGISDGLSIANSLTELPATISALDVSVHDLNEYKRSLPMKVDWQSGNSQGFQLLHTFEGTDGRKPGALTIDSAGNLYGSAVEGGILNCSSPGQAQDVTSGFVMDADGTLYGVSGMGGAFGYGSIYKLTLAGNGWAYSTVYDFTGGADGSNPQGPLVFYHGNLYGSSAAGGDLGCHSGLGCGTVWMVTPN